MIWNVYLFKPELVLYTASNIYMCKQSVLLYVYFILVIYTMTLQLFLNIFTFGTYEISSIGSFIR